MFANVPYVIWTAAFCTEPYRLLVDGLKPPFSGYSTEYCTESPFGEPNRETSHTQTNGLYSKMIHGSCRHKSTATRILAVDPQWNLHDACQPDNPWCNTVCTEDPKTIFLSSMQYKPLLQNDVIDVQRYYRTACKLY